MLRKERPNTRIEKNVESCLSQCRLLLSGTGWSSNLEHHARSIAKEQKINSIAVIDHWVNYTQRFQRNGSQTLPQGIWVSDEEAAKLAAEHFPSLWIQQLDNNWMNQLKKEVHQLRTSGKTKSPRSPAAQLLYLLEPLRDPISGNQNGEEFHALEYWLSKLDTLMGMGEISSHRHELQLTLRQHPSEPPGKYAEWIDQHRHTWPVALDPCTTLPESLSVADMVFGCETQALVAAMACQIPAYSTLPPELHPNRLPHKQLKHLNMIK